MKSQNGATLIIVLFVLILITLVGTLAVKSGILGLKISTNSQVRSLLLENSNSALVNVEHPDHIARQLAADGMFSYFNNANNVDDELVFCYRQTALSNFFSNVRQSAITKNGNTSKLGIAGFCNGAEYSSGRSAVQAQIYVRKNTSTDSAPIFGAAPKGTSLGSSTSMPVVMHNIGVTVISILPNFTGATQTQIANCFKKTAIKKTPTTETVTECFAKLDVPYNLQHADYVVGGAPKLIDNGT